MRLIDWIALGAVWLWGSQELFIGGKSRSKIEESKSDDYKAVYLVSFICIAVGIAVGILLKYYNFLNLYSDSILFPVIGIALIVVGSFIRLYAIKTLKKYFTVNLAISEDHKLITSGFYKVIRHPAYLGALISVLGCGVCYGNAISVVIIFPPYLIFILRRIGREEKALIGKFGDDYRLLMKKTKKLIPFIF